MMKNIGGIKNGEHWFIVNTFSHWIIFYGTWNSEIIWMVWRPRAKRNRRLV
ncbi:hypothetical protein EMIT0180MI3_10424 [Priestia megaterium]